MPENISETVSERPCQAPEEERLLSSNCEAVMTLMDLLAGLSEGGEIISEAASEMQPKRPKRGRPRHHPFWDLAYGNSEAKSDHGKANSGYACDAAIALFKHHEAHPEVLELTGYKPSEYYPEGEYDSSRWKLGILAELGRMIRKYGDGEEVALQLAIDLAHMTPRLTTKQAITWIRNIRLNRSKAGDFEGALGAILRAVDEYLAFHPGTPRDDITSAILAAHTVYADEPDELDRLEATAPRDPGRGAGETTQSPA